MSRQILIIIITLFLTSCSAAPPDAASPESSPKNPPAADRKNSEISDTVTLRDLSADMEKTNPDARIDPATRQYTNQKYGFSLQIPENMTVSSFQEGRVGEVILMQANEKGDRNNTPWIQFFILPFDEEGLITPERIKQDLPDITINNPQYAVIGQNDFKALIFWGQEPGIGKTREVWFTRDGHLYQVTTGEKYEKVLGRMLEGISFEKS